MTNLDYLYNPEAARKSFGKNHFADKKLHFRIIERGTVLPHKNMYVCDSAESTQRFVAGLQGHFDLGENS